MSDAETKWLAKMQKLLNQCPPTLGFYTMGYRELAAYDLAVEQQIDDLMAENESMDFCTAVERRECGKGYLQFHCNVHSTSA